MKMCALCKEQAKKLYYAAPERGICRDCFILERDHPYRFVSYPPIPMPNAPWIVSQPYTIPATNPPMWSEDPYRYSNICRA